MTKGHVNVVLHAHLPFVYANKNPHHLEERWFFEALTESYLPLLLMLDDLQQQTTPFTLTLSLSPTLLAMLDHPVLAGRYIEYLQRLLRLAESEVVRTRNQEDFHPLALFYRKRFNQLYHAYTNIYNRDVTGRFAELARDGCLELITTCATHGYLPLMKNREIVKAQVKSGLDAFTTRFGFRPRGMWLPECGYFPGLDRLLAENGVEYIFVDSHGLQNAWPTPKSGVYAPVRTPAGVAVFARDPETSSQVWSLESGYPGDPDYREYYRDIGFDLDESYLNRFFPYPVRVSTGIKYWRITGKESAKKPYCPQSAYQKALIHAENFHCNRERQIQHLSFTQEAVPLVTAPYDAELFGHWWYEGPDFLSAIFKNSAKNHDIYTFSTPGHYLDSYGCIESAELFHSSWGEGGYSRVWLNPANDWLYPHYHEAESCLIHQVSAHPQPTPSEERILSQMIRELLLAQSSDWAFMLNAGTTVEYAKYRVLGHLHNFSRLHLMLSAGENQTEELDAMERNTSGLFPGIQTNALAPGPLCSEPQPIHEPSALMLSWEYPPQIMGGLARHVDDLSQALSKEGQPVSVITARTGSSDAYELNDNVCVYRVAPYQNAGCDIDFYDWVIQLNLMFYTLARQIIPSNHFTVLHAHDWLVGAAALSIKRFSQLPLIATIHATEYGRNGGLFTPLQKKIHSHEQALVDGADRIICCSNFMAREVSRLFSVPPGKIVVIQNGVVQENVTAEPLRGSQRRKYAGDNEAIIYFVGRLVREKGVEFLLRALPSVLAEFPQTRVVISGTGPMEELLLKQASTFGIIDKIVFTGFVTDEERNCLLASADLTVLPSLYEPFGIVALEAMVTGSPVIVSDVGGMGEVVRHGVDGLKCPPGNHLALSASIRTLLGDRPLRERLGRSGRQKALSEYSWQSLAEKTKQVYQDVWAEARSVQPAAQGGK